MLGWYRRGACGLIRFLRLTQFATFFHPTKTGDEDDEEDDGEDEDETEEKNGKGSRALRVLCSPCFRLFLSGFLFRDFRLDSFAVIDFYVGLQTSISGRDAFSPLFAQLHSLVLPSARRGVPQINFRVYKRQEGFVILSIG